MICQSTKNGACKKAYLFDFDGTLVDSMPSFASVMLRVLDEYNIEYGNDIIKIITPLGYHGTAEYFRKLGKPFLAGALIHKFDRDKALEPTVFSPFEKVDVAVFKKLIIVFKRLVKHVGDAFIARAFVIDGKHLRKQKHRPGVVARTSVVVAGAYPSVGLLTFDDRIDIFLRA